MRSGPGSPGGSAEPGLAGYPGLPRLGPIHGEGWIVLDGERYFVPGQKRRIAAIDAEAGFAPHLS